VRGRTRPRAAQLGGLTALGVLLAASAAFAAPGGNGRALDLQAQRLESRAQKAVLELYSLDSRLQSARDRVASLEAATAQLRHERKVLKRELGVARSTLAVAEHELAVNLRALYEQGDVDAVAVVLGATSLGEGLQKLDDLDHIADESRRVVAATRAARRRLLRTRRSLSSDARKLQSSLASATAAEGNVASTATAQTSYIAALRAQARLRQSQIQEIVTTAHVAEKKTQKLQSPTPVPQPKSGGRKMVVSATCYDLSGTTATGVPVGWGVVAVDPRVIPLGTKLFIPGYGNGVAADIGGGIKGAIIDLWMPWSKCKLWGRRTVTITIY